MISVLHDLRRHHSIQSAGREYGAFGKMRQDDCRNDMARAKLGNSAAAEQAHAACARGTVLTCT